MKRDRFQEARTGQNFEDSKEKFGRNTDDARNGVHKEELVDCTEAEEWRIPGNERLNYENLKSLRTAYEEPKDKENPGKTPYKDQSKGSFGTNSGSQSSDGSLDDSDTSKILDGRHKPLSQAKGGRKGEFLEYGVTNGVENEEGESKNFQNSKKKSLMKVKKNCDQTNLKDQNCEENYGKDDLEKDRTNGQTKKVRKEDNTARKKKPSGNSKTEKFKEMFRDKDSLDSQMKVKGKESETFLREFEENDLTTEIDNDVLFVEQDDDDFDYSLPSSHNYNDIIINESKKRLLDGFAESNLLSKVSEEKKLKVKEIKDAVKKFRNSVHDKLNDIFNDSINPAKAEKPKLEDKIFKPIKEVQKEQLGTEIDSKMMFMEGNQFSLTSEMDEKMSFTESYKYSNLPGFSNFNNAKTYNYYAHDNSYEDDENNITKKILDEISKDNLLLSESSYKRLLNLELDKNEFKSKYKSFEKKDESKIYEKNKEESKYDKGKENEKNKQFEKKDKGKKGRKGKSLTNETRDNEDTNNNDNSNNDKVLGENYNKSLHNDKKGQEESKTKGEEGETREAGKKKYKTREKKLADLVNLNKKVTRRSESLFESQLALAIEMSMKESKRQENNFNNDVVSSPNGMNNEDNNIDNNDKESCENVNSESKREKYEDCGNTKNVNDIEIIEDIEEEINVEVDQEVKLFSDEDLEVENNNNISSNSGENNVDDNEDNIVSEDENKFEEDSEKLRQVKETDKTKQVEKLEEEKLEQFEEVKELEELDYEWAQEEEDERTTEVKMKAFEEYLSMSERLYCGKTLIEEFNENGSKSKNENIGKNKSSENSNYEQENGNGSKMNNYYDLEENNEQFSKDNNNNKLVNKENKSMNENKLVNNKDENDNSDDEEKEMFKFNCSKLDLMYRVSFSMLKSRLRKPEVMDLWGPKELVLFELGLFKYGKEFHEIQKIIPNKSVREIVDMYYLWKKSKRYKLWKENRYY